MLALRRAFALTARRSFATSVARRNKKEEEDDSGIPDALDHATGLEKREMLAILRGDDDPFDMKVMKRGPGTKDKPTVVHSAYHERMIGCLCEEDTTYINWMWLPKGEPRRCECGHWFKLEYRAPI